MHHGFLSLKNHSFTDWLATRFFLIIGSVFNIVLFSLIFILQPVYADGGHLCAIKGGHIDGKPCANSGEQSISGSGLPSGYYCCDNNLHSGEPKNQDPLSDGGDGLDRCSQNKGHVDGVPCSCYREVPTPGVTMNPGGNGCDNLIPGIYNCCITHPNVQACEDKGGIPITLSIIVNGESCEKRCKKPLYDGRITLSNNPICCCKPAPPPPPPPPPPVKFTPQIPICSIGPMELCNGSTCNGLSSYITSMYQCGVGLAAILAFIMIFIGGFLWMLGGAKGAERARKMIQDAILGLTLALTSFVILWIINPNLTVFPALTIQPIQNIEYELNFPNDKESATSSSTSANCNSSKIESLGFPPPNHPNQFSSESTRKWKEALPLALKASADTGVDVGIIGMWIEKEASWNNYMENCKDIRPWNPNNFCNGGWSASNWQAGYGVHPSQNLGSFAKALTVVYGDASNATVKDRLKQVIDGSKTGGHTPLTRPEQILNSHLNQDSTLKWSLGDMISQANNGNHDAQVLLVTLAKDPGVGIYLTATHFKEKIADSRRLNRSLADIMHHWGKNGNISPYYDPQRISNEIAAACEAIK